MKGGNSHFLILRNNPDALENVQIVLRALTGMDLFLKKIF